MNKIKAFDANEELAKNINKFNDMAGTEGLCVPLAAAYTALVKQVNTFVKPVTMFKSQIIDAIDSATTDVFDEINEGINILSTVTQSLGSLQIQGSTLSKLNILKTICLDFDDILPFSVQNMIDNAIDESSDWLTDKMESWFDIPDESLVQLDEAIDYFKSHALSSALSDTAKFVLSPLDAYRTFIKNSGIITILERMKKFERCMTNPQHCNRPRKDFYYPGTHKYNSQYYMDLFAINLKGEIQLKRFVSSTKRLETRVAKTLRKLDEFRKSPITNV